MDMYQVKWTRLQSEIFRLFCIRSGMPLNIREVARALKVTPTAVSNALPALEKGGIVRLKRQGKMNLVLVELNRDNARTIQLKRAENLRLVYESGLFDVLYDEFPGCAIVLFGSYSRGEDVHSEMHRSDIDIAVIGTKGKDVSMKRLSDLLEREISLNFYGSWGKIHKNLRDSILGGIVLGGGVDL